MAPLSHIQSRLVRRDFVTRTLIGMSRLALGRFAFLALAASAWTSSSTDGQPPPGPLPLESVRAEADAAKCEALVRCGYMPDRAACSKYTTDDYELLQLLADVVAGRAEYDPAAGRTWVEAVRSQRCALIAVEVMEELHVHFRN